MTQMTLILYTFVTLLFVNVINDAFERRSVALVDKVEIELESGLLAKIEEKAGKEGMTAEEWIMAAVESKLETGRNL